MNLHPGVFPSKWFDLDAEDLKYFEWDDDVTVDAAHVRDQHVMVWEFSFEATEECSNDDESDIELLDGEQETDGKIVGPIVRIGRIDMQEFKRGLRLLEISSHLDDEIEEDEESSDAIGSELSDHPSEESHAELVRLLLFLLLLLMLQLSLQRKQRRQRRR